MHQKQEILSVSQLSHAIKHHLEARFPTVTVQGEVSNLKEQSSGHLYFTLKDAEAQISAVLFKGNARTLSKLPKNGDQVVLKGEINVYPPRGYYQIIVRELSFAGVGELLLKLHEMKLKMQERGWFDKARKKKLPKYPKTIGVVTSPTGSVIQDILHILTRRLSKFHLILNPVKVQGEGAAEEIARAIDQFNAHTLADVLIIGRGGGSLEDLWAFNEEIVAHAIFQSRIPIICAVGHETDYCIADFVADVRAPTPSAAAEIVTAETAQQLHFLAQTHSRLKSTLQSLTLSFKKQLAQLKRHPYLSSPYSLLAPHIQRIDDFHSDVEETMRQFLEEKRGGISTIAKQIHVLNPKTKTRALRDKMQFFERSLSALMKRQCAAKVAMADALTWRRKCEQALRTRIHEKKERLEKLAAHLKSIDPKNLLSQGYCILFQEKTEALIASARDLTPQDKVRLVFHDGNASLTVDDVKN